MGDPALAFSSVIEQHLSRALENHVSIRVSRPGNDGEGDEEAVPLFLDTLLPGGKEPSAAQQPPSHPSYHLDDNHYKKLVQSSLACWQPDSVSSFPGRIALCDWVSRALQVSPSLHHAALVEAVQSNAHILQRLHHRLRFLNENLSAFAAEFPTEEGAAKYRFEEIRNLEALVKSKLQNAPYAGLLEVAVLHASGVHQQGFSYASMALPEQRHTLINKRKKRHTQLAMHDRESGSTAWMEKMKPIAVTKRNTALRVQVKVSGPGKLDRGANKLIENSVFKGASRMSSKVAGQTSIPVPSLANAVLPTPLTFDLRAPPTGVSAGGAACFASGSGPSEDGASTLNGELHLIVRFMEECHSPESLGQVASNASLLHSSGSETQTKGSRQPQVSDRMDDGNISQQMLVAEEDFQAVLESMWHAWEKSVKFYGMNDSEVSDELHSRMVLQRHTFLLNPDSKAEDGGKANDESRTSALTFPTGAALSPGVYGLVSDQVTDMEIRGFSPDHSWWVVIQRFCTMFRVRRQRRDLGVLGMMLRKWDTAFGYLRALRGVFQPLVTAARKQELTVREFFCLRAHSAHIASLIAAALTSGPGELLKYDFDEAVATFRELQKLLLPLCAGDGAAWSTDMDGIAFELFARGAVDRLTARVQAAQTEKALEGAVAQNVVFSINELQVDLILRHAYLGGVDFCQYTAYVRYQEIVRELELLGITAAGERAPAPGYSTPIQVIEDQLYALHSVLAKERLLDESLQLADPLGRLLPIKTINVSETFARHIGKWIQDSKSLTSKWVQNAVELDTEDVHSEIFLSPSLLEMFRVVQEMLGKVSRRTTARAVSMTRRLSYGDELLDLFRGSIQTYSEHVSEFFVEQLEESLSKTLSSQFPAHPHTGSGTGTGRPPCPPIMTLRNAHYISGLWLVLCNQHVAERGIQECSIKGCEYKSFQLNPSTTDLQCAEDESDHVSVASDSFLSLDSDDDDTMVDQWKASKHGQLKDVQQSISSLLLEMVVGVGNSYCAVISTAIEQSAAKGTGSQCGSCLERLEEIFTGELQLLDHQLNRQAFTLVLECTWYSMLRVLEVGVLQTSADWGLMNDDAGAISQILELLSSLWHGNGAGLPSELIHETSARLRSLIRLHSSPVVELETFFSQVTAGESLGAKSFVNSASINLGEMSTKAAPPSQLAHDSIVAFIGFMKSSTTREVGLLELMRLLRQRSGDRGAELLGKEIINYAVDHMQEMLGLENAGTLLTSYSAKLKEYETQGIVFVLTNFIVFTDMFTLSMASSAMQAVGIGRPLSDVTEVLPVEHIVDVQKVAPPMTKGATMQITMMDNTARTFELESADVAHRAFLQCNKLAGLEQPKLERHISTVPPRVTELLNSPSLVSWTPCALKQIIWATAKGNLIVLTNKLIFVALDDELNIPVDDIKGVVLSDGSGWSGLGRTGVQVTTGHHKKYFYEMEYSRAEEIAGSLRRLTGIQ